MIMTGTQGDDTIGQPRASREKPDVEHAARRRYVTPVVHMLPLDSVIRGPRGGSAETQGNRVFDSETAPPPL